MRYKHIVFDIDGTLLDNEYAVLKSFQETLEDVTGETVPLEELRFCLGIPGETCLERYHIEDIPGTMERWLEKLYRYHDEVRVFDGISEVLEALAEAGYELGIVSSKTREEYEHSFMSYEIARYFGISVCAEDSEEHKPAAGPLLKYMERSGMDRSELLYVGDSKYDKACAANAGVDFALAVWGNSDGQIEAERWLARPEELLSMLGRNRQEK